MTVTTQPSFAWQLFIYAACQSPLIRRSVRFNCRQMGKQKDGQDGQGKKEENLQEPSPSAWQFVMCI